MGILVWGGSGRSVGWGSVVGMGLGRFIGRNEACAGFCLLPGGTDVSEDDGV